MTVVLATDTFTRTDGSSLGTADLGGAYTLRSGGTASCETDGSSGGITSSPGDGGDAFLYDIAALNLDVLVTWWMPTQPIGTGTYVYITPRANQVDNIVYRWRIRVQPSGTCVAQWTRTLNLTNETSLGGSSVTLPFSYNAPDKYWIRVQALGSTPTTLQARVWKVGDAEPSSWNQTTTDNNSTMQQVGSPALSMYTTSVSGSAGTVRYDNLTVTDLASQVNGIWGTRLY